MSTQRVGPAVALRRAENPGPMTLDGTNSYLLGRPGGPTALVDPGPSEPEAAMERHRTELVAAAGPPPEIVLTHRHLDHSGSAAALARQLGTVVHAADPGLRQGGSALGDGDALAVDGLSVTVVATPGHTSDSVSLLVRDGRSTWLLTGDTVLGRGSTVITRPDGDLGAYLASLTRLQVLVAEHPGAVLLPGHGPVVHDPARLLRDYVRHRHVRLQQVRAAVAAGDTTAAQVVARVYADVDPAVRPAAEQSVAAQLDYLHQRDG